MTETIILDLDHIPTADVEAADPIDWSMLDYSLPTPLERFEMELASFLTSSMWLSSSARHGMHVGLYSST